MTVQSCPGVYSRHVAADMLLCMQDDLGTSQVATRFGSEFVAAVNKVNYNQANTLNAFAGQPCTSVA